MAEKKNQEVTGTFLYFTRTVYAMILPTLGTIMTQEANPTENTMNILKRFLDYAATYPNVIITYRVSIIAPAVPRIMSYLSESKAGSHAGGYFFMASNNIIPANNSSLSPRSSKQ